MAWPGVTWANPGTAATRPSIWLGLLLAASVAARADQAPTANAAPAASAAPAPAASAYPLSVYSAIGSSFAEGNHLPELGWTDAQIAAFIEGIRSAFNGKPYPMDAAARQASDEMGKRAQEIDSQPHQKASPPPDALRQYIKEACKRLGLDEADSGLCYSIAALGKGDRPGPDDTVVISCSALAADGHTKLPELSSARFRVKVADLLPGLREGVQMMAVGSQGVFLLPPALSFGAGEWPKSVESGSPILFQVTLHAVVNPEPAK
jgi:FKBP-type peptidyl-prolyl cis-trans isomerase FkpA